MSFYFGSYFLMIFFLDSWKKKLQVIVYQFKLIVFDGKSSNEKKEVVADFDTATAICTMY